MIYVFYGEDFDSRSKQIQKIFRENAKAVSEIYDDVSFSFEYFLNIVHGYGLFDTQKIILIKNIFSDSEMFEKILNVVVLMSESEHIFIFSDREYSTVQLRKIKELISNCTECQLIKKEKDSYNIFAITNHLEKFDKKNMWLAVHEALGHQNSFESIIGILLWKLKTMIGASTEQGRRFSKTSSELKKMYMDLIDVYHKSRTGFDGLVLIEDWILSIS